MKAIIGIGREEKNQWERRVPLIPAHVRELVRDHQLEIRVQTSPNRIFPDTDYRSEGAKIVDDLSACSIVFGIKEFPIRVLEKGKVYIFFTHTTKGQSHNMPLLKRLMDLGCNMIDYEKIVNEKGQRLLFFGRQAGQAGMVETLWSFGQRLKVEGLTENPFAAIRQTYQYRSLDEAKADIQEVGRRIQDKGLAPGLVPMVCGFTGYGHVSQGAQEIFGLLPFEEISPGSLAAFFKAGNFSAKKLVKVVFKESDMVRPKAKGAPFELQDYYDHPEKYEPVFDSYVPYLSILVNCIFWAPRYPKYLTKGFLKELFGGKTAPRLRVLGDITCDINGSMEGTVKATEPDVPSFVYDPVRDTAQDGFAGPGLVVMAVDNLPAEIPLESSVFFSGALKSFVPQIASADFSGSLADCRLPDPIRKALILFRGELTPEYEYMRSFIR